MIQVVVAVILIWLWNCHEVDFQRAFAKSGRIDVDPTCKWLVFATVDVSVRALSVHISNNSKAGTSSFQSLSSERTSADNPTPISNSDVVSASVVSKALWSQPCLDEGVVSAFFCTLLSFILYQFHLGN